jgi:tyrosyl-tRNA synthetase
MGKSVSGAVWLNKEMLSVYDYWQFWRNTEDGDVGRFLRLFTDMTLDEIVRLEKLEGAELNEAKKVLATEATALLHGLEAADKAASTARQAFEQGGMAEGLPTAEFVASLLDNGLLVTQLAFMTGLTNSSSEARRQIEGGGLRVNDVVVTDVRAQVFRRDVKEVGAIKLSIGKKKHLLAKPK